MDCVCSFSGFNLGQRNTSTNSSLEGGAVAPETNEAKEALARICCCSCNLYEVASQDESD